MTTMKIRFCSILSVTLFLLSGCSSSKSSTQTNSKTNDQQNLTPSSISSNADNVKDKEKQNRSGLLLGLVKEPDFQNKSKNNTDFENKVVEEYRTLWIYENKNNISYSEKKGGIITPYEDKFLKVTSNNIVIPTASGNSKGNDDYFYNKYSSFYNFSVIISQNTNEEKNLLTKDSLTKNYLSLQEGDICGPYISRTETIQYVGNKYAAVRVSQFDTGGGTLKIGSDDIKLYDIKNLANLGSKRENVTLKSLLGSDVSEMLKPLSEKYDKAQTDNTNKLVNEKYIIDDNNLILKRKEGKWVVQAPLYEKYTHTGNGTSYNLINAVYDTNINVPKAVSGYDTLAVDWDTIKSKIPDAKDAVSSPNKEMLVVLTENDLRIFLNPEKGLDEPVKTIPVDKNEKVVLNQWATGEFVDKWTKILSEQ